MVCRVLIRVLLGQIIHFGFYEVVQPCFCRFRYRLAVILFVLRSFTPTTVTLSFLPLSSLCLFFSRPPRYTSSILTGSSIFSTPAKDFQDSLSLCTMNQADFCMIPRSRWIFIEDTPFRLVANKYVSIAPCWYDILDCSMTVPFLTEKYFLHTLHQYGILGWLASIVYGFLQVGQTLPFFQISLSNHFSAVLLSGNT